MKDGIYQNPEQAKRDAYNASYSLRDFALEMGLLLVYGPYVGIVKLRNVIGAMMAEPRADQDGF